MSDEQQPTSQRGNRRGRPGRPAQGDMHRAVIDRLVAGGALIGTGFSAAVRDATGCQAERMTPDAFVVSESAREVRVYEVEVYHPVDDAKWDKLESLARDLAAAGWTLRLWLLDRRAACVEFDPLTRDMTAAEWERTSAMVNLLDGPTP